MLTLPSPPIDYLHHSNQLLKHIQSEIDHHQGSISFSRYMEMALYTPNLGYYSGPLHPIGKEGDFVTAPEISPLFSHCLAQQCAEVLSTIPQSSILEIGAGNGQMAADLLLALEKKPCLPTIYYILELSGTLQHTQKNTLTQRCPHLMHRIHWLNQLPSHDFKGIILANEVMDALPVERFEIINNRAFQIDVTTHAGQLGYQRTPIRHPAIQKLLDSKSWPQNYSSEICPLLEPWITSLAECLSEGVVLLIDYGYPQNVYYHPERVMGTLLCYFQHHVHDNPLLYPGLQDITAHVNFSAIAEHAKQIDLTLLGYTHQSAFLMNCGILELLDTALPLQEKIKQNQAVERLLSPHKMGESHKVIALGKNYNTELLGFRAYNKLYTL